MKRTGIAAFLVILALATGLTLFNRCSGGEMATVTIYFEPREITVKNAHRPFLTRLTELFITRLHAKGNPWSPSYTSVTITATGPGMSSIEASVPPYTTSYTLEIPSGPARIITITAYDDNVRMAGGSHVTDLAPSEERAITIRLLPIPINLYSFDSSIYWDYDTSAEKYIIYQSSTENGTYVKVAESVPYQWWGPTSGMYYKVSMYYTAYGEGLQSNSHYFTYP